MDNTLSENGAVTRGICETNEEGYLTAVHETSNIVKTPEGAAVDNDGQLTSINAEFNIEEFQKREILLDNGQNTRGWL